ncbi:HNH endonuclease [Halomonas sp. OfavH-34-E]|uniref:HNH endonuclease n=1 Tax=Halomonas sp. OfavH-34-E TaxID=2954491 RepID=UPI002097D4D7|nr:HNH endonuclease [Halomonas sp. OfavH-34-E]MCO7215334.1 HNH endonuclease [Halomonas sp. OfavH-34-E]
MQKAYIPAEAVERFHSKYQINPRTGCWEWTDALSSRGGYGRIKYRGEAHRAHRVSYMIHKGAIPDGMVVCHQCDNPACVNPDHLWLGTHMDNNQDMIKKGRGRYPGHQGEANPRATLTRRKVQQIIHRMMAGQNNKQIAQAFGVSHATISLVRRGKIWTDVPRPDHPAFSRYAALKAASKAAS